MIWLNFIFSNLRINKIKYWLLMQSQIDSITKFSLLFYASTDLFKHLNIFYIQKKI